MKFMGLLWGWGIIRGGYRIPGRSGCQPLGGYQHTNLPDFPKNCMKLRKFWSVGGRAPREPPLGSATDYGPFRPIGSVTDQYFISFNLLLCCQQLQVNDASGGSRIPPRRGRQLPRGAPTYDFAKFSQKLHEIERIWTLKGGASKILLCRSATGR